MIEKLATDNDRVSKPKFSSTGSLQLGRPWLGVHAWPGAVLTVSSIRVTVGAPSAGELSFRPGMVWKIAEYRKLPWFAWGIQIHHSVRKYPRIVRFLCWSNPLELLRGIETVGFVTKGKEEAFACFVCGAELSKNEEKCSSCGWSYLESKRYQRRQP
jgi:hypothetical protein